MSEQDRPSRSGASSILSERAMLRPSVKNTKNEDLTPEPPGAPHGANTLPNRTRFVATSRGRWKRTVCAPDR